MGYLFVRCPQVLADTQCTVAIGARSDEELIEAAIEHAHIAHAEEDTPALREAVRRSIREGEPAAQ